MFLTRIAFIAFLLGCLVLSHTDAGKQLWMGFQVGRYKKSRGNYDVLDRIGFRYWRVPATCDVDFVSGCANLESEELGVVNSILAWVWPILLGFVVNTNTLILLSLPAYHHGRALHVLHGLSDDDDSQSQLKAWEQLIRPLMEEWKTVCVLATLTSGYVLHS